MHFYIVDDQNNEMTWEQFQLLPAYAAARATATMNDAELMSYMHKGGHVRYKNRHYTACNGILAIDKGLAN